MTSLVKKIERSSSIYPWYQGISGDLIFLVAINTIWFMTIKGFTEVQINLLTTVSSLTGLIFQLPVLALVKRIKKVYVLRLGSLSMLTASIMFTFCNQYIYFIIAQIFYELAFVFGMIGAIVLKENLEYLNKGDKYIAYRSRGSLVYATLTAVVTLSSGFLFNIHNYLPMLMGTAFALISLIISFFIADPPEDAKKESEAKKWAGFPKPYILVILVLIYFGLSYAIVSLSQQNGKLLIQQTLLTEINIEKTAVYLSLIMFISRMVRILGNCAFPHVYKKLGNKTGICLVSLIILAGASIFSGIILPIGMTGKVILMSFGFSFVPFLRDPLTIFTQNFVFQKFKKEYHEDIIMYMSFGRNICQFVLSLAVSAILLRFSFTGLFAMLTILAIPIIFIAIAFNKNKGC